MAVLSGITVTVAVNGRNLTEHDDNSQHHSEANAIQACNTVTKYIEATPNTKFMVKHVCERTRRIYLASCHNILIFTIYLDGVRMDEHCMLRYRGQWKENISPRRLEKRKEIIEKLRFGSRNSGKW